MPEAPPAAPAGRRRWRRRVLVTAVVLATLVAAGNAYLLASTRAAIVASPEAAPARRYALVLGNRVYPDGVPSRELTARLEMGLAVYQAGRARKIIVSGLAKPGYDEPHAMAAWLEARGVPASDVVLDLGGYRTAASMADAAAMGTGALLVVSQGYHLPRAIFLADRAGLEATGVAAATTRKSAFDLLRTAVREGLARAESLVEVVLRGVRGDPAYGRAIANAAGAG